MSSPRRPDLPAETGPAPAGRSRLLVWIVGETGLLLVCATLTVGSWAVRAVKNAGLAFRFDPAKTTLVMIGGDAREVKISARANRFSTRKGSAAIPRLDSPSPVEAEPPAVEEPEAKFSALAGRAQALAQSLAGEAEVLPAVFTPVEPAESAFKAAADHGVALVGRNELNSLFGMLSAIARKEGALSLLNKLRS
jgi:hypothetical protein